MAFFTDEKYFDLDGVYNVQNDHIWTVSREEADKQGGIHQKTKFPAKGNGMTRCMW